VSAILRFFEQLICNVGMKNIRFFVFVVAVAAIAVAVVVFLIVFFAY
jgi:hypothetical protein